jgi:hypothetical protein
MEKYVVLKDDNKPVLNADITRTYIGEEGRPNEIQPIIMVDSADFGYPGAICQTRSFQDNVLALVEQMAATMLVSRLNFMENNCISPCRSNSSNLKNFVLKGIPTHIMNKIALLFCCYFALYGSLTEDERNNIFSYIIKYYQTSGAFSIYFLPGVLNNADVAKSQQYGNPIQSLNIVFKNVILNEDVTVVEEDTCGQVPEGGKKTTKKRRKTTKKRRKTTKKQRKTKLKSKR